jgi:hypothetical protein
MGNLYVGLFHFPMRNRSGEIVATALTSVDVHDIARTARTYGVARYFVVTPLATQQAIAWRIREFWTEGERQDDESGRGEALELISVASDLDETLAYVREVEGVDPLLVGTSARPREKKEIGFSDLKTRLQTEDGPVYILFGTGWGMADELVEACDVVLPPVMPESDFNHLSVRAAAAIILDRVAGDR